MSTKQIIERDGYIITLYVNSDKTVDLNKMMAVEFLLQNSEIQKINTYPTPGDKVKYGTINDQFEYAKSLQKLDNAFLNRGIDPVQRGGARPGSGRKKKEYETIGPFKLETGIAKILREQEETTITGYIENAVLFYKHYKDTEEKPV